MTFSGNNATTLRHRSAQTFVQLCTALSDMARDLQLLASVYVARFIVWRELRRRRR
jgi:hypothetical protein